MKKWIALLLGVVVTVSLAGCGSTGSTASTQESSVQAESTQEAPEESSAAAGGTSEAESVQETDAARETTETASGTEETTAAEESTEASETGTESGTDSASAEGRTLVVYYSATGNTEAVANYIAQATGGDLFELEPVDPYTDEDLNWTDENSRVVYEHDNEDARDVELVADTVDNWDEYDTVFIGYPIWWGIAAWPVDTFVEANDFTGKTVIPFCTSSSSDLGESGQLLAEMAGTGDWQEGMRFRSSASEADVQEWLNGLGL
ncbi:MAG TPA: flavodoxin [Candidatus Eisenbergiella intestinigallinarum]|uniref:Flavodoxin n=1 Tax=Candidatus Eisenbergiella intestinigallinarum TaxID=2838549 RepID=A0A9D2QI87_9FIRM|nr:flavodoxin [Candidatus Eisenbergiella intestinigallinarum]